MVGLSGGRGGELVGGGRESQAVHCKNNLVKMTMSEG